MRRLRHRSADQLRRAACGFNFVDFSPGGKTNLGNCGARTAELEFGAQVWSSGSVLTIQQIPVISGGLVIVFS
ncbi:MAG: hypothetical protein ACREBC_20100, partial [Pyrinomonadaceae bacterium]